MKAVLHLGATKGRFMTTIQQSVLGMRVSQQLGNQDTRAVALDNNR